MSRKLRSSLQNALTIDKFQTWLSSRRLDYQVGRPRNPKCCPIANYLASQTKRAGLEVTQSCVWDAHDTYLHRDDPEWPMPLWVSDFITAVDQLQPEATISAEAALAIFTGSRAEHGCDPTCLCLNP